MCADYCLKLIFEILILNVYRLLLKADLRNTDIKWELVIEDRAYSSYSLVEVCLPLNLVLLANSSGHIKVLFLMSMFPCLSANFLF